MKQGLGLRVARKEGNHENFLATEENYLECELFWDNTFDSLSKSMGQSWVKWMPPREDFEVLEYRDGAAIFDAKSLELDRGFSILQHSFG